MGLWQRWKEIEWESTIHPCDSCDAHADAPLLSWRNGVHRTWCPTYGRKLLAMFLGLLFLAVVAALAPKRGRYFDWRLFAFMLNAVVVMLLFHVRARKTRAPFGKVDR